MTTDPVTTTVLVEGMTCEHCVRSVTEEVSTVPGVSGVAVDLVAGGATPVTVTSEGPIDRAALSAAIDEAGYAIVP